METQAQTIEINGRSVRYYRAGERAGAPAVVLLHGGGVDCAQLSWGLLLPELAEHFQVLAPDYPGYGESALPAAAPAAMSSALSGDRPEDEAFGVEANVTFLQQFLDALDVPRASLVGISMGGAIALGFTLRNPQRVDRLVLVDSYGLQRKAPFHALSWLFVRLPGVSAATWRTMRSRAMTRYSLQSLLARPEALTPELFEQVYREANRPNAGIAFSAFQRAELAWRGQRTCYMDRLGEIQAPTLIIHGEKDGLVPPDCAREAQQRIPGARLVWMPGSGHWPQRDDPERFNRVVKDFLLESTADPG